MSTLARAWEAFVQAVVDARDMHEGGAEPLVVADLVRYAQELLDIMNDEIENEPPEARAALRLALATMRSHLALLDSDIRPSKH